MKVVPRQSLDRWRHSGLKYDCLPKLVFRFKVLHQLQTVFGLFGVRLQVADRYVVENLLSFVLK